MLTNATTKYNTPAIASPEKKQPPGLYILFFVEMWERFGFYCVQSLLVLYLSKVFLFSDTHSYDLFSAFSALIYATPVIGGYLADRYLGFRRAIILGGILYIFGYFGLASLNQHIFYLSLAALICGNGFFKANVSSLLGTLYNERDPRRDSGFTIFYMGINLGSLFSTLACTYVAAMYGWQYGFGMAGVGMVIGVVTCILAFKHLGDHGLAPDPNRLGKRVIAGLTTRSFIYLGTIIALVLISFLVMHGKMVSNFLIGFGIVAFSSLLIMGFYEDRERRNKLFALLLLMLFSIAFWALYTQTFSSLTLFTDRIVNRHILGFQIPTAMFQSVNPFFIITLSPLVALMWIKLYGKRLNPSTPMKFAIALLLTGASFVLLTVGIKLAKNGALVGMVWLIQIYFLQTVGELFLSPVGLSAVTELAPPRLVGMVMGIWFMSLSAAYAVGGRIADLTAIPTSVVDLSAISKMYAHNFLQFGYAGLAIGILLVLFTPKLKMMMSERKQSKIETHTFRPSVQVE